MGLVFALSVVVLAPQAARAVDFEAKSDVLTYGDYRYLNQKGLSQYDSTFDGWLVAGSQLRARQDDFLLEVRPEIRGLSSRAVGLPATDPGYLTIRSPRRFFNIDYKIASNATEQWYGDFERLDASYGTRSFELYAGRKPISLGVLKVLPVWNKFTRPLPNAAGPALIFSQDSAGVHGQTGELSYQAFDLEGYTPADEVRLGELALYDDQIELHLMMSQWWHEAVGGLAATRDVLGMTVRAEALWIGMDPKDEDRQTQAGPAPNTRSAKSGRARRIPLPKLGASRLVEVHGRDPVALSPAAGGGLCVRSGRVEGRGVWTLVGGAFTDLVDGSTIFVPRLSHSLSDDAELYVNAQIPTGKTGAELGPNAFAFPDGTSIGSPLQIGGGVKVYF